MHLQVCAGWKQYKSDLLAFTFLWNCHQDKEGKGFVLLFLSVVLSQECHLTAQCFSGKWLSLGEETSHRFYFRSKSLIISLLCLALFVPLCFKEILAWNTFYVSSRTSAKHSSILKTRGCVFYSFLVFVICLVATEGPLNWHTVEIKNLSLRERTEIR